MLQTLWDLSLLALIIAGPLPLSLFFSAHPLLNPSRPTPVQLALSTLVLWILVQISLGLVLGSLQRFTLWPVILLEIGLATLGLVLLWIKPLVRSRLNRIFSDSSPAPLQISEGVVIGAIAFTAFVLLDRVATQPFTNYDTLWFHGPILARWYQTGSLSQLDPLGHWIIDHPDAQSYPYHWHILGVFFLLPLRQDLLLALPMLLAWSLLGLSTYLLSSLVGAQRFYALASAALVGAVPFVLNHVTTLHIDLPLAAVYTISLYYLMSYHKTRHSWDAFLFLATAGLLAGIKTPGLIYALFLIAIFLVAEIFFQPQLAPTRSVFRSSLFWLGAALGLGLGSFWYIHNALEAGPYIAQIVSPVAAPSPAESSNPEAEATVPLGAILEKIGYLQSTTLTSQFNLTNPSHWFMFLSQAIVRLQLPVLALLAQVMLLPVAWIKSPKTIRRSLLLVLCFLLLSTWFLYWNTPYSSGGGGITPVIGFNMRYGFPVLGILGVVAAASASLLNTRKWVVVIVVLLSSVLGVISSAIFDKVRIQSMIGTESFWPSQLVNNLGRNPKTVLGFLSNLLSGPGAGDLSLYLSIFMLGFSLLILRIYWPTLGLHLKTWLQSMIQADHWLLPGLVSLVLIVATTHHWQQVRDQNRLVVYQGIDQALEQWIQPTESLAYFASRQSYLFYGKHLNQSVIHLPLEPDQVTPWLATLRQANVTLVAAGPELKPEPLQQTLAGLSTEQGPLQQVFGQNPAQDPTLYRLSPAGLTETAPSD